MLEPLIGKLNELRIVLASSSEQRVNLLNKTGLKYEICPSNFEENLNPQEHTFSDFVEKTALGKAEEVWQRLQKDSRKPDLVIGVDTMVTYNGRMYGKPKTKEVAIQFITDLTSSNLPNLVYTGVALITKRTTKLFTEVTSVHMLKLTPEEIISYVETGEPLNKAGGYGIQGLSASFVRRIEGDQANVIGLPVCRLSCELKELISKKLL